MHKVERNFGNFYSANKTLKNRINGPGASDFLRYLPFTTCKKLQMYCAMCGERYQKLIQTQLKSLSSRTDISDKLQIHMVLLNTAGLEWQFWNPKRINIFQKPRWQIEMMIFRFRIILEFKDFFLLYSNSNMHKYNQTSFLWTLKVT